MDNTEEVVPSGIELPTPVAAVPAPEVAAEDEPQQFSTAQPSLVGGPDEPDPLGDPVAPAAEEGGHEPFPEATVEELIEEAKNNIVLAFRDIVDHVHEAQHLLHGQLLEDFNRALHMAEAGLRVFGVEPGRG